MKKKRKLKKKIKQKKGIINKRIKGKNKKT